MLIPCWLAGLRLFSLTLFRQVVAWRTQRRANPMQQHSPHALPFGRFKGHAVTNVDTAYLRWYAAILRREKFGQLLDIIQQELRIRDQEQRLKQVTS